MQLGTQEHEPLVMLVIRNRWQECSATMRCVLQRLTHCIIVTIAIQSTKEYRDSNHSRIRDSCANIKYTRLCSWKYMSSLKLKWLRSYSWTGDVKVCADRWRLGPSYSKCAHSMARGYHICYPLAILLLCTVRVRIVFAMVACAFVPVSAGVPVYWHGLTSDSPADWPDMHGRCP